MTPRLRALFDAFRAGALPALAAVALLAACSWRGGPAPAPRAADAPAPGTLMGDWHVVARVPWFGERGRVASRIRLEAAGPDRITITRRWRDGFAEPLQTDASHARSDDGGRTWRLRAWGLLPTRLRVLEAAADGRWMLLDAPGRDHAWILARDAVVDDAAYLALEQRMRGHGVNTDKLRRVAQVPEQEGRLGFEPAASPTPGR